MSEDRQLRAAPLILDYEPLSRIFQDVGQAIRARSPRLARIDVSKPGFLAQRDLPPVPQPILQNPFPIALLLLQAPSIFAAIPTEGVALDRQVLLRGRAKFESTSDLHFRRRG